MDKISVTWAFCFGTGLMLLLLPLRWCAAMLLAASIHELCHIGAVYLCGGRVLSVRVGFGGAVIDADIRGRGRELLCAIAGPLGGLCILIFAEFLPITAVCALFQSAFNLLPIYPLDGGRALRCILEALFAKKTLQRRSLGSTIEPIKTKRYGYDRFTAKNPAHRAEARTVHRRRIQRSTKGSR